MSEVPAKLHSPLADDEDSNRVAAFVDARESGPQEVVWTTLKVEDEGYPVLVLVDEDGQDTVSRFCSRIGAVTVPASSRFDEVGSPRGFLESVGATLGYDEVRPAHEVLDDATSSQAGPDTDITTLAAIPAYNEAQSIGDVVSETLAQVDEVLVVDDGSTDATVEGAKKAGASVIEHERNGGYGAALQTAFQEADRLSVDHLVILDADGQHDPTDIPDLIDHQTENDAEMVIGSRFVGDGGTDAPLYRRFGLSVVNTLTNLSLGVVRPSSRVRDTQSGFRAYDETAVRSLADSDDIGAGMNASTDIIYHAHHNGFDIEEVGTEITYQVEDTSNHNPVSHGITLVSNILKTVERERPILSLGIPGSLSTMIGLGFAYWTISNYLSSGTFPLGLAVTSVFFGLTGTFACFTAIILHSLSQHLD